VNGLSAREIIAGTLSGTATAAAVASLIVPCKDNPPATAGELTGLGGFDGEHLGVLGSVYVKPETLLPLLAYSPKEEAKWQSLFLDARPYYDHQIRTAVLFVSALLYGKVLSSRFLDRAFSEVMVDVWRLSTSFEKVYRSASAFAETNIPRTTDYNEAVPLVLGWLLSGIPFGDNWENVGHYVRHLVHDWSAIELTEFELTPLEIRF